MLSAPSQLLMRNVDTFAQGKWLLVNPTDSQIAQQLNNPEIKVFHQYFDIYQQSCAAGNSEQHTFAELLELLEHLNFLQNIWNFYDFCRVFAEVM